MTRDRTEALRRWQRRTNAPLLVLALVFLVVFLLPLYRPDLPATARQSLHVVNVAIWFAFVVDYVVRLSLVSDRGAYVRNHVPDLLVIIIPVLRPLRVLRVAGAFATAARRAGERRVAGTTAYVLGAVALLLVIGAGLALDAERGAEGANITSTRDALWWAMATVTTVGYGDRFPVTDEGRAVATGVMLCGIALLGVVTAAVATWFIERVQGDVVTEATLHDVLTELREVRARLDELTAAGAEPHPEPAAGRPGAAADVSAG